MKEPDMQEPIGSSRLLVPVLLAILIGQTGTNLFPFILGGLIDYRGFDPAAAGLLGSMELGGMALAAIGVAGFVSRGRRRMWLLVGIGVVSLSQAGSSLDLGYEALLALRVSAGLGEGLLVAVGMAAAAGASNPTRLFAQVMAGVTGLMAVEIVAAPFIIGSFGLEGIFLALAIMTLLLAPMAARLSSVPAVSEHAGPAEGESANRNLALLAIAGVGVLAIGQMMIWTVSERLGLEAELSAEAIGIVLAIGSLMGVAGAGLAAWLGTRYGNLLPVVAGLSTYVISAVFMVHLNNYVVYLVSNVFFALSFTFYLPYIQGALASLDRTGRWTATASGVQMIGVAAGPLLGGVFVGVGWWAISAPILISAPIGLALMWRVLRFVDRSADDDAPDTMSEATGNASSNSPSES